MPASLPLAGNGTRLRRASTPRRLRSLVAACSGWRRNWDRFSVRPSLFESMSTQESEAGPRVFGGDESEEVEEEEYDSDGSESCGKRHKASDIWEGFWILKRHENFQCTACKANSGKSGASLLMSLHSNINRMGPDFNAARRAMAMFIISSGQSLSLVENYYFQLHFRSLNPTFPICRAILDRDVMNLYEREGYRRAVGFKLLQFTDDAPSVAETIASCIHDLDVDKKVVSITFDNTLGDVSVASSLKKLLHDEGKLLCDGELCRVHCCMDILNSAVKAGLELIADVIEKIRQGNHCINHASDLTYKMLGCALHYKDALNHFASTDGTFLAHFHLCDEEWNKAATMKKFLKVLYDIICSFLSKQFQTASLYFLGVYKVYRLLDVTKGQENLMSSTVEDIKAKFDVYWSEYNLILACAAVLDPRYKLNLVSYYFRKIYDNADTSQHITRVVALLNRLFTEYQKSSCSSSVGTNLLECHIKDDFFDDYSPPKEISELDWYLESPVMVRSVDLDILKFWSGMSNCYPNLANLARDILAIPVSTVATKSAFTIGKKILNYRRSGLSPYLLEMVICLHDWTCPKDRNEGYCTDDDEEEEDAEAEGVEDSDS